MSEHAAQDPSVAEANSAQFPVDTFETSSFDTFEMSAVAPMSDPIEHLLATSNSTIASGSTPDDNENASDDVADVASEIAPEVTVKVETVEIEPETLSPEVVIDEPVAESTTPVHSVEPTVVAESPAAGKPLDAAPEVSSEPLFADLSLRKEVLEAVLKSGYEKPTAIQAEIIPHMLAGRDVLAQSQTGTGKTAAFALPILSRIKIGQKIPQVLVLTPTRELAIQVARSFSTYASSLSRFSVTAIYGGSDYTAQFRQLERGVEVVVGTPGRVIDHIKRGTLDLSELKCLVLDEADEMLNMGFLDDVKFVLEQSPDGRQIALFSATLPPQIRTIAQQYLNDPARITIQTKTMTADSIRQRALVLQPREKIDVLKRLLDVEDTDGVIIFSNTKDMTVTIAEQLNKEGLKAVALNGDMPQKTRERTIEQLKAGNLDILVATDVAARGLDVTRVSHVFNYDVPQDNESYIHRIGRTGRAGRKGEAIIFLTNAQRGKLRFIERATKQTIEIVQPPSADDINAIRIKRFTQQITETATGQDLAFFQEMITKFSEESDTPLVTIAAALAQISQNGRPFLVKDRAPRKEFDRNDRRDNQGERGQKERGKFSQQSSGGEAAPRGRSDNRQIGPPEAGKDRYRIEVGWNDGVKVGNIVGAIANEGGIGGEYIGPIKIHDSYATVDLPEGMPREIYNTLQRTRVAGKPMMMTLANDATDTAVAPSDRPRPSKNFRSEGPRHSNGPGNEGPTRGKPAHAAAKRKFRKGKTQSRD
ncbi:MAG: DEAD/DEAH box helicase [Rhodopirellula sp.]|nr:DEAD/DEAH box helicase [Rhodopirellula sp.]